MKHGAAWGPRDEERGRTGRVATEPGCWWSQPSPLCSAPARAPQGEEGAAGRRQEPSAHPPLSEPGVARPVPLLPARLLPSPRSPRPAARGARGSGPAWALFRESPCLPSGCPACAGVEKNGPETPPPSPGDTGGRGRAPGGPRRAGGLVPPAQGHSLQYWKRLALRAAPWCLRAQGRAGSNE